MAMAILTYIASNRAVVATWDSVIKSKQANKQIDNKTRNEDGLGVVAHTCNTNTWETEAGSFHEFEASLAYNMRPSL